MQSNFERDEIRNDINTSITHITSKDGNIFEDLGFSPVEASKLKIKARLMCQISEWIKEKVPERPPPPVFARAGAKMNFVHKLNVLTSQKDLENFVPAVQTDFDVLNAPLADFQLRVDQASRSIGR